MKHHRDIKAPNSSREGFANFVQAIINRIEEGNVRGALMKAVDLLDCISAGAYGAIIDTKAPIEMCGLGEIVDKDPAVVDAIAKAREDGIAIGIRKERVRLAALLGLGAE